MIKQHLHNAASLLFTWLLLLFLGFSGDPIFHAWGGLAKAGGVSLPPVSQWLLDTYGYNDGVFARTCISFAWIFTIVFLFCVARGGESSPVRFRRGASLLWLVFGAYIAFLILVAAMPFWYAIRAMHRPDSLLVDVVSIAPSILPVTAVIVTVYAYFTRPRPQV